MRKIKYQYLDDINTSKLEVFVRSFVLNILTSRIKNLKLDDFVDNKFDYNEVWSFILTNKVYQSGNIYYDVDTFLLKNNINDTTPANRNSLFMILEGLYKELNVEDLLNKKLIKLFHNIAPRTYLAILNEYEDEINQIIKDACFYKLTAVEFNIC